MEFSVSSSSCADSDTDSTASVSPSVQCALASIHVLPACIVCDLDDTIWEGDIEYLAGPPFVPCASGKRGEVDALFDGSHRKQRKTRPALKLFPDVLSIFAWLASARVRVAIASRTRTGSWATEALSLFTTSTGVSLWSLIEVSECYDTCKTEHLKRICEKMGLQMADIVFYDNRYENIEDVESMQLGNPRSGQLVQKASRKPVAQYTPEGLNFQNFIAGLLRYQHNLLN